MKNNTHTRSALLVTRTRKYQISTGVLSSDETVEEFVPSTLNDLSNVVSGHGNYSSPVPQRYRKQQYNAVTGTMTQIYNDGTFRYIRDVSGPLVLPSVWFEMDSTIAYNKALTALYEQFRGTTDLSVTVAQAGQVRKAVEQVFDIVHYVRKFPSHALKSMYKDYLSHPKRLGSAWLAFQYGWKPLAQDVFDTVNGILGGRSNLCIARARASDTDTVTLRAGIPTSGFIEVQKIEYSCWVEIKCKFDINSNAANDLSRYTSLNPVSIAWELVPFSFVVDWVVDVGGYLRNLETALLSQTRFISGYTTISNRTKNTVNQFAAWSNGPNQSLHMSASGSSVLASKSRSVGVNSPLPRPPRFEANLGSGRLLNAAALLSQHLR